MRAFPGWYEYNSIYVLFPLTIPSENKILTHPLACRLVWDEAICDLTGESLSAEGRVNAGADDKLLKQVFYNDVPKGLEEIRNFPINNSIASRSVVQVQGLFPSRYYSRVSHQLSALT